MPTRLRLQPQDMTCHPAPTASFCSPCTGSQSRLSRPISSQPLGHIPGCFCTLAYAVLRYFRNMSFFWTWSKVTTQKPAFLSSRTSSVGSLELPPAGLHCCDPFVCLSPPRHEHLKIQDQRPTLCPVPGTFRPRAVQRQDLTCSSTLLPHTCEPGPAPCLSFFNLLSAYGCGHRGRLSADHSVPRIQADEGPQEENTQDLDKQGVPLQAPAAVLRVVPSLLCWAQVE